MFRLVNLTPHAVTVILSTNENGEQESVTIPASGTIARVQQNTCVEYVDVDGLPFTRNEFGAIENLPEPETNVRYIVSAMVESAAVKEGRMDCVFPCTPVRDGNGNIIGCRSLGYTR